MAMCRIFLFTSDKRQTNIAFMALDMMLYIDSRVSSQIAFRKLVHCIVFDSFSHIDDVMHVIDTFTKTRRHST